MAQEALANYLMELAENPAKVKALRNNPDAELDASGLSDEEKDVVKSGDPARIRSAFGDPQLGTTVIVIVLAVA
jgi:hypothetical protein